MILSGSLLAVSYAVYGLYFNLYMPADRGIIIANIFWAMVNTGIAYTAVKYAIEKIQRRKDFRFPANILARNRLIVVDDLHERGALIQTTERFKLGSVLSLRLSLGDKTVEIKGIVLYLKRSVDRKVPVFYYGIEFEDDSRETRDAKDAIIAYNFSYAVNKMMKGLPIDNETPLLKFNNIIRKPPMRLWRTYEK